MTGVLLIILLASCAALLVRGFAAPGDVYQYPCVAGAVLLGFVVPQLVGMTNDHSLPPGALDKTLVVTILCTWMCWLGFVWPVGPARLFSCTFDEGRLAVGSLFLSLFGAFFFYKISTLPEEITRATSWSGIVVAYDFFSRVLSYGFVLALILYLARGSRLALAVLIFDGLFYFHRIVIAGRRWTMVEFTLAVGFLLWLHRRIVPPRLAIVVGLVFGTLVINGIGQYRALTLDPAGPRWSDVLKIDLIGSFTKILEDGSYELRNTVFAIEAVDRRAAYDFGTFNWNALVFNWVPAQIVGKEFKEALIINVGGNPFYEEFRYIPHTGTTLTGISDAFASFSYFGALKFFLIALIMRRFYLGAWTGNLACQMFYVLLLGPSLLAITHHTQWFFSTWLHVAVFVLPVLWLCRAEGPVAQGAVGTARAAQPSGSIG